MTRTAILIWLSLALLGLSNSATAQFIHPALKVVLPCDTWVALPDATTPGCTILAKNSDRPLFDCQPLVLNPRKKWPTGSRINVGRVKIPQVKETHATLGSSPYWCWGYEEGINEHGVAIGNEGIWTKALAADLALASKEKGPEPGPTGMDLIRLGLERGKTAREALDVITELLERHGQFGSGLPAMSAALGSYENSFIIADPREAWVLETSGRRWVARRFTEGTTSISNLPSIGTTWDLASTDLVDHAVKQKWWPGDKADAFDFAKAYAADTPEKRDAQARSQRRAMCSRRLLLERAGRVTTRAMMGIARDRTSSPSLDLDQTASSCVALLPAGAEALPVFWWCPATPSNSCYVPFFVDGHALPRIVSTAGVHGKRVVPPAECPPDRFSAESYWWLFRDLCDKVRVDYKKRNPVVRAAFDPLEKAFESGLADVVKRATVLRKTGHGAAAAKVLDDYSAACVKRVLEKVMALRARLESEAVSIPAKFQPYVATYVSTVSGNKVRVIVQNEHLGAVFPGNRVFELVAPDENGKWFFKQTRQLAVSFVRDGTGAVITMKLYQRGLTYELIRKGVVLPPEVDLKELQKYLGKYRSAGDKKTVEIIVQNNRLAIDWPAKKAILELHAPDASGVWAFRLGDVSAVRFDTSPEGRIVSFTYLRNGKVADVLTRVPKADAVDEAAEKAVKGKPMR